MTATRRAARFAVLLILALCPAVLRAEFFNGDWERIGVDAFQMHHIAPREKFHPRFPLRWGISKSYRYVGVRAITDNPQELLQ